MDEAVGSSGDEITRGFLFADLRGYTELVEAHGALEASHLLERYRALTREVVGHHGGAEIKTEGDSFYVVLPSASAAVRCGLALVAACATPPDGGAPIAVGVGIHAGESVAHEGGFVGSAVNIAARICAAAGTGELLASGTIRDLTRSMTAARFDSIGRRPIKGLAEPVELFRVMPEGAPPATPAHRATRVRARPLSIGIAGVALVALAIVALGGVILAVQGGVPSPTLAPSSSGLASSGPASSAVGPSGSSAIRPLPSEPADQSVEAVTLAPGTYAPNGSSDVASLTIPEGTWALGADDDDLLELLYNAIRPCAHPWCRAAPGVPSADIGVGRIRVVYLGACREAGTKVLGDRPQDLIEWVQSTPQLQTSAPRSVNDLGLPGIAIDASVLPQPTGGCSGRSGGTRLWQIAGVPWSVPAGAQLRVEALSDRAGRTLTLFMIGPSAADVSNFALGPGGDLVSSIVLR